MVGGVAAHIYQGKPKTQIMLEIFLVLGVFIPPEVNEVVPFGPSNIYMRIA